VELEAKGGGPNRSWTPVVPVPEETIAVAMFQWKRVPITRAFITRMLAYAVIIVVLCTLLAYAASATSPAQYGARQEILYPISEQGSTSGLLRNEIHLQTQIVTIKSRQVLTPVAAKFHMTVDELGKKVSASVVNESQVIRVQINDHVPATATALVRAVVNEYFRQRPDDALEQQNTLKTQIAAANAAVTAATDKLNGLGAATSPAATAAQSLLQSALDNRNTLQSALDTSVAAAAGQDKVQQLTQPYLLDGKVSPKPLQAAIAGLLLGLMLAAGVVVLLVRRMLKRLPLDQLD
jgi:capsular polysaccharide biosynthesis protein